eukprot:gene16377-22579_t
MDDADVESLRSILPSLTEQCARELLNESSGSVTAAVSMHLATCNEEIDLVDLSGDEAGPSTSAPSASTVASLRAVIGDGPSDDELVELLETHSGVEAAASAWFDDDGDSEAGTASGSYDLARALEPPLPMVGNPNNRAPIMAHGFHNHHDNKKKKSKQKGKAHYRNLKAPRGGVSKAPNRSGIPKDRLLAMREEAAEAMKSLQPVTEIRNSAKEGATLAFNQCAQLLKQAGHRPPDTLFDAIKECEKLCLVESLTAQLMHSIRKTSNLASHLF